MDDRYVSTSNGTEIPMEKQKKQSNMVDDFNAINETLQEMRKRLCAIGESAGCMGCITNDIEHNITNAREETKYIKEMSTTVLYAVTELQKFIG